MFVFDNRQRALPLVIILGSVIFYQSECCVRGRTRCIQTTIASVQALIFAGSLRSPTRLSRLRLCSFRNAWEPARRLLLFWFNSYVKITSIYVFYLIHVFVVSLFFSTSWDPFEIHYSIFLSSLIEMWIQQCFVWPFFRDIIKLTAPLTSWWHKARCRSGLFHRSSESFSRNFGSPRISSAVLLHSGKNIAMLTNIKKFVADY